MKTANAEEAAKYVFDERFPIPTLVKDFYTRNFKYQMITNFNIEEVQLQDKEKASVKVNLTYKDQPPILQSLTMIKKDGEWKVYVPPRRKQ
ncbi:hypothetical protein QD46_17770 [Paenibacillus polymyxa]|uniref:DUF4878 domain-containing protein n=1 Tax=Paenibacillus polymyxa TaxID=1406 RepID=UPI0005CF69A7|nr:DUF4878 domain-containing protein [Paenibacillus polymyxa]KJD38677.1 hypothetical protein QD46_17770 [Paenibacillus polymyxa]MBY7740180.1 DUF4878 domain-containing protein [Paenibacillus polymyxa]